jgi:hypothetical protein
MQLLSEVSKTLGRICLFLLALPGVGFVAIVLFLLITPFRSVWAHNQILKGHVQDFQQIQHPAHTVAIAREQRVTRPPANGQRCFYFVGEVRQFSGDKTVIQAVYQRQSVQVEFLQQGRFGTAPKGFDPSVPYGFDRPEAWQLLPMQQQLYLVYTLNTDWTFAEDKHVMDWRCH